VIPLLGSVAAEDRAMMGERMAMQDRLFYEFRLEEHVPAGYSRLQPRQNHMRIT
jgi:hypothetical protein